MRHPTDGNMKNQSFIFTAHVIAEQFKQSGITVLALIKSTVCIALSDTNNSEFCILLATDASRFHTLRNH
jgi:hypothetical protein